VSETKQTRRSLKELRKTFREVERKSKTFSKALTELGVGMAGSPVIAPNQSQSQSQSQSKQRKRTRKSRRSRFTKRKKCAAQTSSTVTATAPSIATATAIVPVSLQAPVGVLGSSNSILCVLKARSSPQRQRENRPNEAVTHTTAATAGSISAAATQVASSGSARTLVGAAAPTRAAHRIRRTRVLGRYGVLLFCGITHEYL